MSSLPTWAAWSIAAAAVLSPALAFLAAIAIEILIDVLLEADAPSALLALIAAAVIGWLLFRKVWTRTSRGAAVET